MLYWRACRAGCEMEKRRENAAKGMDVESRSRGDVMDTGAIGRFAWDMPGVGPSKRSIALLDMARPPYPMKPTSHSGYQLTSDDVNSIKEEVDRALPATLLLKRKHAADRFIPACSSLNKVIGYSKMNLFGSVWGRITINNAPSTRSYAIQR